MRLKKKALKENKNIFLNSLPKIYIPLPKNNIMNTFFGFFKKGNIHEGLLKTFPLELTIKHLCNTLRLATTYEEFYADVKARTNQYNGFVCDVKMENNEQSFNVILFNSVENDTILRQCLSLCGFFISSAKKFQSIDELIEYECEKKFTENANDAVKEKRYISHVTTFKRAEKIMKQGFVPKAHNKKSSTPQCVYFTLDVPNKLSSMLQVKELYLDTNLDKTAREGITDEYALIVIDTKDLNATFYFDPNTRDAVYTYDNIAPQHIVDMQKIQFETTNLN